MGGILPHLGCADLANDRRMTMNMFNVFLILLTLFIYFFILWSIALELCAIKNVLKEIRDKMKGD